MAYETGKRYMVPTVHGFWSGMLTDWPVMGGKHEDNEIIGFPHQHYHIDWRFVNKRLYQRALKQYRFADSSEAYLLAVPLNENKAGEYSTAHNPNLPEPVMKLRLCKRQFPAWPRARVPWIKALEDKYADCQLKTPVCPHRGVALDNLPCKHGSIVECPAHGLNWDLSTGKLVRMEANHGQA